MKKRTVMIIIKGETADSLKEIRERFRWLETGLNESDSFLVKQVSVHVAHPVEKK